MSKPFLQSGDYAMQYDFQFWRAVITLAIVLFLGYQGLRFIKEADSGHGKLGGRAEFMGVLFLVIMTWFLTSTFQAIEVSQFMRMFNPWQVPLLVQAEPPRKDDSNAEYDLIIPKDSSIGDTWYTLTTYTEADAQDGFPLSKTRQANGLFWYSKNGVNSRTQLVP
ncbi:MAG TPA: hypothetical protein VJB60_03450 [Candidatus Peribacterales bacterium]|nr:hypothetical protein [Candidatus Peribacterales bacterium]